MSTKLTANFQTKTDVNLKAPMICGRTGINKLFSDLTDDDIKLMIEKGSKFFEPIPVVVTPSTAASNKP